MTKVKLSHLQDFENLLDALKEDGGIELSFQFEESPSSYPCIAIYHYSDDANFGSAYNLAFVYPSDF